MKIENTTINGLLKIAYDKFNDKRGMAAKVFCKELLDERGIEFKINDLFYSISNKDVIRGMHFQTEPYEQEKLVFAVKGKILDVVIDLRPNSKTFKQYEEFYLDSNENVAMFIPKGCAHGFKSLEDDTMIMYAISGKYSKEHDKGIKWDSFEYDWKVINPILNERDEKFITMNEHFSGGIK